MIDYIEKEFSTAKQRFKKYFSMEHSLGNMMEIAKSFFFLLFQLELMKLTMELRIQREFK